MDSNERKRQRAIERMAEHARFLACSDTDPHLYQFLRSVDKSYFNKATDVFNEQYKVEDEKQTDFDNLSDDELMEQMRELEK